MILDQWPRIIAACVAPAVIVSASGLLCLAFYNRLAAIVARLRVFQRERLQEQERITHLRRTTADDSDALRLHRRVLDNLAEQTRRVIRRARLIRLALLCLLSCIAAIVVSSILNGLTLIWPSAMVGAAVTFLVGMLFLLAAVAAAFVELLTALHVVELESGLVSELTDPHDPALSPTPNPL